jgi:hypothetical protein
MGGRHAVLGGLAGSVHGGSVAKAVYTAVPWSSTGLRQGVPDKAVEGVRGVRKLCRGAVQRRTGGMTD